MPFNLRNTLVTPRDSSHQPVTEALKYCRGVLRIRMRRFLEHPYRKESEGCARKMVEGNEEVGLRLNTVPVNRVANTFSLFPGIKDAARSSVGRESTHLIGRPAEGVVGRRLPVGIDLRFPIEHTGTNGRTGCSLPHIQGICRGNLRQGRGCRAHRRHH